MAEEGTKPQANGRRWVTRAAIALSGLFGLVVVVVVCAYFALRSSLLQSHVVPWLAEALESEGVALSVQEARLDLLRGLSLEGVQLRWANGLHGAASLRIGRLNLAYDLGLFGPELLIDELLVRGVRLEAALSLPAAETSAARDAAPPAQASPPPLDLGALEALLAEPPLTLRVKRLRVEDVELDLELEQGGQRIAYRQRLRYEGEAVWLPGALQVRSRLELAGDDARLSVAREGEGERLGLQLAPNLRADLEVVLERREGSWRFALEPLASAVALSGIELDQTQGGERLHIVAERFDLGMKVGAQGRDGAAVDSGLAGLFPLKISLSLDADLKGAALASDGAGGSLAAAVEPRYRLAIEGEVDPFGDPRAATAKFEQRLELVGLRLDQVGEGAKQRLRVANQELVVTGELHDGRAEANGDWRLAGVEVPEGKRPFAMHHRLQARSDLALARPEASFSARLDEIPLLDLTLAGREEASAFTLQHRLRLELPQRLAGYHPAAAALQRVGGQHLTADGRLALTHGAPSLLQADAAGAGRWPIGGEWHLALLQREPPRDPEGVRLSGPLAVDLAFSKGADYTLGLGLDAKGIQVPPLAAALPIALQLTARVADPRLSAVESSGELRLGGAPGLDYRLTLRNQPQRLELESDWRLRALPEWQRYLPALEGLSAVGAVDLQSDLDLTLLHPAANLLELDPAAQAEALQADARLAARLAQTARGEAALVHLVEPVTVRQRVQWSAEGASLTGGMEVAAADVPGLQARGVSVGWGVQAQSGLEPKAAQARLHLDAARITALQEGAAPLELAGLVAPSEVVLAAGMEQGQVRLGELRADVGGGLLGLSAAGSGAVDGSAAQLGGRVALHPRPKMIAEPPLSGAGRLELPWELVFAGGEQLTLDGSLEFEDFALHSDAFAIRGVNGRLRLEEELRVGPGGIGFGYLVAPDPFQRVDFERIHPYLEEPFTLSVASLSAGGQQFGPLLADVPIRQNLLRVQRFNLGLFGGHLAGQLYFDATPGAWRVGLLGRASHIDLRPLLPEQRRAQAGEHRVNARAALEFDIGQRLLEGRVDLTDMSREQLLQLLDIIDPAREDEQLATVRSGLAVAYPQRVAMEMDRGLLTLEVALSTLPQPIAVRGLPLSAIIQRFAGEALQSIEALPLEPGA